MYSMRLILIALIMAAFASLGHTAPSVWQDMIPRPKQISVKGEQWVVAKGSRPLATILVPPGQPKSTIGAQEINQRIGEMGGPPLPVVESDDPAAILSHHLPIVISTCYDSKLAKTIITECGVKITPSDPGEQGYVIRFLRFRGRPLILLVGSDPQGALYAAVTMRWLIERTGDGTLATVASVRDWPDFKWRGINSVRQMIYSLPAARLTGEARMDGLKRQVDWILRAKLNLLGDYGGSMDDVTKFDDIVKWMHPLNAYARERGIIGELFQSISVGLDKRDAGNRRFAGMMHIGKRFFTWSDDELIRKRAREIADICDRSNLGIVVLHCPDGGGPIDPEMWSKRSEADHRRWGNDRASADAHVFTLFYEEIKRINPDIRVVFAIYPYHARYLNFEMFKPRYADLTREQFEWAGREYLNSLGPKLPKESTICVWMSEPQYMDEFRSCFGNRPMYYYNQWSGNSLNAGWLVSTFRYIGTNFYGNPNDIMAVRFGSSLPNYINRLLASQFAWDTRSEGSEVFSGSYYDFLTDNDGPDVVTQQWGQRACRHMWGAKLGPVIHGALKQGIIPSLIVNPAQIIRDDKRNALFFVGRKSVDLTSAMMLKQADGCARAARELDKVIKMAVPMDDLQESLFVYYLQRTHCLAAYALAQYYLLRAQQSMSTGDAKATAINVANGIKAVDDGRADMARILKITATMRCYDPGYNRRADEGVFPAIPGTDANFQRIRKLLEDCK
jgi:hypothetical protein